MGCAASAAVATGMQVMMAVTAIAMHGVYPATHLERPLQPVPPQLPSTRAANSPTASKQEKNWPDICPPLPPAISAMLKRLQFCYLATIIGGKPHGQRRLHRGLCPFASNLVIISPFAAYYYSHHPPTSA